MSATRTFDRSNSTSSSTSVVSNNTVTSKLKPTPKEQLCEICCVSYSDNVSRLRTLSTKHMIFMFILKFLILNILTLFIL